MVPGCRPAAVSASVASSFVLPVTAGTTRMSTPLETKTWTSPRLWTRVPLAGSERTTSPAATVSENSSSTTTPSPAPSRSARTEPRSRPSVVGIAMYEPGPYSVHHQPPPIRPTTSSTAIAPMTAAVLRPWRTTAGGSGLAGASATRTVVCEEAGRTAVSAGADTTAVFMAVSAEPVCSRPATSALREARSAGRDSAALRARSRAWTASAGLFAGSRAVRAATRSSTSRGIHGWEADGRGTSSLTWWVAIWMGLWPAHGTSPVSIS